jgi:type IV pilus assembly protein PilM
MASPFGSVFKNLFGGKSNSVIGIDIGSSAIKVVQLKKNRGVAVLETYGELALGPYGGVDVGRAVHLSKEKLTEALRDVLHEANITTTRGAIAISMNASLVSLISMPAVPKKQLDAMIPLEARKYIPVPITEVSLDWMIVPPRSDAYSSATSLYADESDTASAKAHESGAKGGTANHVEVLIVAIHNEALEMRRTLARETHLSVDFLRWRCSAQCEVSLTKHSRPYSSLIWVLALLRCTL